jgi:outer membrane protein
MTKRILCIFFLALLCTGALLCQETESQSEIPLDLTAPERPAGVRKMDLDEFVDLGLAQNPIMVTAAQQVVEARAQYEQIKSEKVPKLVLTDGTTLQQETSVDTNSILPSSFQGNFPNEFVLISPITNQLQLSLQVLLTTFGKVENTIAAAFINIDAAAAKADVDRYNLIYTLKQAYFQKLRADANVVVARENLAITKENLSDTQALFNQGVMAKYDLLQAQIEVTRAVENLSKSLNTVDLAAAQITNVLAERSFYAQPIDPPSVEVSSSIQVPTLEEFALEHRAEMRAIRYTREAAQKLVDAAYGENQPTLTLAANYQTAFGQSLSPVNYPSLTLNLQWYIFDGGYRKAKVKEAEATLQKIVSSQETLENDIILQVDQRWLELKQSAYNLTTAQQQLANTIEYHYMARERFINGLATSLEVSDSLRNLITARAQAVDAKYARDLAFARLEQALGRNIPDRKLTPETLTSAQAEEIPEK